MKKPTYKEIKPFIKMIQGVSERGQKSFGEISIKYESVILAVDRDHKNKTEHMISRLFHNGSQIDICKAGEILFNANKELMKEIKIERS